MESNNMHANGEIIVLVTGFGDYGSIPITAGRITRLLPSSLPKDHALNPSGQNITILDAKADFACIPAELGTIRTRVKQLHDEFGSRIRLWVHLGQWGQDWVACERRAFRQDFSSSWSQHTPDKHYYMTPDGVKQVVDDLGANPWLEVPMGLNSEVPIDVAVSGANAGLEKYHTDTADSSDRPLMVRSHFEAGSQGCGFIFYESMANCFVNKRKRDVMFVHVPPQTDQASLEKARDAVLAVIGSAITALVQQKPKSKEENKFDYAMIP